MELAKSIEVACKLTKELYQLVWTIEGFNLIPYVRDHPVFGPSVRLGKQVDSTWQLLLSKQRGEDDKLPSLGFKLVKTEDNTVWDVCRYDIAVKDASGELFLKIVDNGLAGGEEDLPYKYAKGVSEDKYKNEDGKEQSDDDSPVKDKMKRVYSQEEISISDTLYSLFKESVLIIVCDIRYTYMINNPDEQGEEPEERLVVQDFKQLYKSQKFSDVILCAGNKEFSVHKSVLCSRTFGFDVLLQEDMEQLMNRPKLNLDMPEAVADMMLLFLYSGEFSDKLVASQYYDLYKASKKFGINRLKELCLKMLTSMAKDEPACNDCCSDEETFLKLVECEKMIVDEQAEVKRGPTYTKTPEFVLKVASLPPKLKDSIDGTD